MTGNHLSLHKSRVRVTNMASVEESGIYTRINHQPVKRSQFIDLIDLIILHDTSKLALHT